MAHKEGNEKMKNGQSGTGIKAMTTVTFLIMIIVNALANILPINGVNTGQVSDSYPNLFAPAGLTFAIWGLIYILLAGYVLYQLGFFQVTKNSVSLTKKVGIYFSISSIANATWIFSWHYHKIALSMILMLIILICLILIVQEINQSRLAKRDILFIKIPFSIYFGWITVATIANATTLLVSIGWDGFGISEALWAMIIIAVGLIIGSVTMIRNHDVVYGLVFIWAYLGILIKHISANGFAGQYPGVITTTIICIVLLIIAEANIISNNIRKAQGSRFR